MRKEHEVAYHLTCLHKLLSVSDGIRKKFNARSALHQFQKKVLSLVYRTVEITAKAPFHFVEEKNADGEVVGGTVKYKSDFEERKDKQKMAISAVIKIAVNYFQVPLSAWCRVGPNLPLSRCWRCSGFSSIRCVSEAHLDHRTSR